MLYSTSFLSRVRQNLNIVIQMEQKKDTITIVLILTTFASIRVLFPASEGFLAVSTHKLFFSLHFWTMLTAGFYERFVPLVIVDIVVTAVAGSFLEKKWKPGELLAYVLCCNFIAFAVVEIICLCSFMVSEDEDYVFTPMCGFSAAIAGMTVGLFQYLGDKNVLVYESAKMLTYRLLPAVTVLSSVFLWVIGGSVYHVVLTFSGAYFGWFYLRFFKKNVEDPEFKGDARDEFAFEAMFPTPARPYVTILSAVCIKPFNMCGLLKDDQYMPLSVAPRDVLKEEERRVRAIKAIDDKIAQIRNTIKEPKPLAAATAGSGGI
eukprot:15864_1